MHASPVNTATATAAAAAGSPCVPNGKVPYASVLFEDTPEATKAVATKLRDSGYSCVKFGWGPSAHTTTWYGHEASPGTQTQDPSLGVLYELVS